MKRRKKSQDPTQSFYQQNAREYAKRTNHIDMSLAYASFDELMPPGSLILDLGCGGGRDARHFAIRGHGVIGMDPCLELLIEASRCTPANLALHVQYVSGAAPELPLRDSCLSGIWACASLLHLPRSSMAPALADCARVLRPGGVISIMVKRGSAEELREGRFFTDWQPDELDSITREIGFTILENTIQVNEARQLEWIQLVARKSSW